MEKYPTVQECILGRAVAEDTVATLRDIKAQTVGDVARLLGTAVDEALDEALHDLDYWETNLRLARARVCA